MTIDDGMRYVLLCWGSTPYNSINKVTAADIRSTVPDFIMPLNEFNEALERLVEQGLVCKEKVVYYDLSENALRLIKKINEESL